jgi:hypothetical protein
VIADDTGSLNDWGSVGLTAAQVAKIKDANKPILGVGEGGYAFFGRLSLYIGWPRGWHGPQQSVKQAVPDPTTVWSGVASPAMHYFAPTNSVGIYLKPDPLPADVVPVGLEVPPDDHASIILQGCRMLWGAGGNPTGMTGDGKSLFLNAVNYMHTFQCPTPPPTTCYTISKTANPLESVLVPVGGIIEYTLHYQLNTTAGCPTAGKLVDMIPFGTMFVPGSATDLISPAGGLLTWTVFPSAGVLTKSFKVRVTDNVCTANKKVANFGELRPSGATPLASATLVHNIDCPAVGLPTSQPMFAEDELQVHPYPMVAGTRTLVSVRVRNLTAVSQPVTVQFQASPAIFGIGLVYNTFGVASATVPGNGTIELSTNYVPVVSGNQCIQASVSAPGMANPLITQRCLDVTEDFTSYASNDLIVPVRNNTGAAANITLVVDNTCPGWSATVAPLTLSGVLPGATPTVTLTVTRPASAILGSGCHIDLQAWIGDVMIGGIRKLDVPPVHLPFDVRPPWEEPEIIFRPDPPQAGIAGQLCIQLVNPLATTRAVTIEFSAADFGAGIGFSPATIPLGVDLPPNSIGVYCAAWTPAASGTLHRCVLATLKQAGYLDQTSQRNVDILRPATRDLSGLVIPFMVGNPDMVPHALSLVPTLVGISPVWGPIFETNPPGGPMPTTLLAGEQVSLRMRFGPSGLQAAGSQAPAAPSLPYDFYYGSRSSVEVNVLLDGSPVGGFSVQLQVNRTYIAVIKLP